MKKYIKYIVIAVVLISLVIIIMMANKNEATNEDNGKFKIVTSFYPIYIMTENITQGASNIELVNMADTNVGCIHNYTLNTQDMKILENADVFIQNGLGLESFVEKVTDINKKMKIINSSSNIQNLIEEENKTNPHIWTSIENYIKQVQNISNGLIEINPENEEIYKKNTDEYIAKIKSLQSKFNTELQKLKGKSAIILNESFEYLAKQLEMNITTIHTDHEESTISAETLKNIINKIKSENIKIIIVDKNDDLKNAQTIANETGAKIYKLNSCLTGELSKDAYLDSMDENINILKNADN